MTVFIHDAVRTPRGKARSDGSLAAIKPQDLVAGLVDALDVRVGEVRSRAEMLALGCVGQIGAQGGHIALVSKFRAALPDAVRREGSRALLHSLGCSIGGCRHETVEAALDAVAPFAGNRSRFATFSKP